MKGSVYTIALICAGVSCGALMACAQEMSTEERMAEGMAAREMKADEKMAAVETEGYVEGDVIGVNNALKTVTVKDTEYDNEIYVFAVNQETTFSNVSSLRDIMPGDTVTVDYFALDGVRVADNILVEERGHREEQAPPLEKVLRD